MDPRTLIRRSARVAVAAAGLGVLGGCVTSTAIVERAQFDVLRARYIHTVLELHPVTALYLGGTVLDPALSGANGRLRDYRPEAIAREVAFFREIQRAQDAIHPEKLQLKDVPDYLALNRQLDYILQQLENTRYYERAVSTYVAEPALGVRWQLDVMPVIEGSVRGSEPQWRAVLERLNATPAYLDAARVNLLAGKARGNVPEWHVVESDGIFESRATADYFRTIFMDLARRSIGEREFGVELLPQLERAATRVSTAYDTFALFLRETYGIEQPGDFVRADPDAAPVEDRAPGGFAVLYR